MDPPSPFMFQEPGLWNIRTGKIKKINLSDLIQSVKMKYLSKNMLCEQMIGVTGTDTVAVKDITGQVAEDGQTEDG